MTSPVGAPSSEARPRTDARRVLVDVAWWVALVALVAANLAVLIPGIATVRLWEDEAFNLSVPLNLVRGLGYASDGTLSGSELAPFDVRISTGPVMLLPIAGLIGIGVDPVFAGRGVATAGYLGLLVALALVGRRLGGRWAAVVAVAVPLAFETAAMPSPIQTPVDVLGEVTAAAFLVAALLFVHRRPWLAGLMLGLAIQVKFIALLAVPAFTIAVLLDGTGPILRRARSNVPKVLWAALAAAAPTVLFEVSKLLSLGAAGYVQNVREFGWFLRSGGQRGYAVPPLDKLGTLLESWNLPVVVAAVVAALVVAGGTAVLVVALRRIARSPEVLETSGGSRTDPAEFRAMLLAAALGLATYLAWWLVSRHTPAWVRHPAPAVLAFVPVLVAAIVPAARIAWSAAAARWWRAAIAGVAAVGIVALAWSIAGRVGAVGDHVYPPGETLSAQREAARDIAELGYDHVAVVWGPGVSIGVLAGAHVGLTDAVEVTADDPRIWFGEAPPRCDVELESGEYLVCIAVP
ncbi:glycosyltransferase 87 family protein [Agromyces sp. NPDC056523]|uniref:glycosyltransferase 87 family protein n=1 Tax=Agromyces sp. NPDC056523 TaxID=3345850 RepID=UPI00366D7384